MFKLIRISLSVALIVALLLGIWWFVLQRTPYPEEYTYGVSFNTLYAEELDLDWEETYTAILKDLGARHLRLAAHWPMIEPENDEWNFKELDRQIELAEEYDAKVVLAVGRRLPRWPECHVPEWAKDVGWEEQKEQLRKYIRTVVERYKDSAAVAYWQVENEPFLTVFAPEHCGSKLDKDFLDEEIALVHELDTTREVQVTDSGNLGTWWGAYKRGDVFGTSVYVYLYNEKTGPFKTVLPPEAYIAKRQVMQLVHGKKETVLIELSLEPWLAAPIVEVPLEEQFERLPFENLDGILAYARETRLERQYLWGAEWWYWLKTKHDHPEYWEYMQKVFIKQDSST